MKLVWKECRDLWPRCAVALGLLVLGLVAFVEPNHAGGLLHVVRKILAKDAMAAGGGGLFGVGGALLVAWACWVGHDAIAGETADDTWSFLRTRPVSSLVLVAGKLGPRVLLVVLPWVLYRGAVLTFLFWGAPDDFGYTTFTTQQQLDAQYEWTSPPYTLVYMSAGALVQALTSLAVAMIMGSFVQHRGVAFAGALLGAILVTGVEYWAFEDAITVAVREWQVSELAFAWIGAICAGLLLAASLRIATLHLARTSV